MRAADFQLAAHQELQDQHILQLESASDAHAQHQAAVQQQLDHLAIQVASGLPNASQENAAAPSSSGACHCPHVDELINEVNAIKTGLNIHIEDRVQHLVRDKVAEIEAKMEQRWATLRSDTVASHDQLNARMATNEQTVNSLKQGFYGTGTTGIGGIAGNGNNNVVSQPIAVHGSRDDRR